jgi:hypothetical protein
MSIDNVVNKTKRRDFLKKSCILTLYPIFSTIDSFFDNNAFADDVVLFDEYLKKLINQPILDTLNSLKSNYIILDELEQDYNYKFEVFTSNSPVIGFFYSDCIKSKQNAVFVKSINKNFPEIKIVAYRVSYDDEICDSEIKKLKSKYDLKDAPGILFYKRIGGKMTQLGHNWSIGSGFNCIDDLKNNVDVFSHYISDFLLR